MCKLNIHQIVNIAQFYANYETWLVKRFEASIRLELFNNGFVEAILLRPKVGTTGCMS